MNTPSLTLNTGAAMPLVGLGTWKSPPATVGAAVEYALMEAGYRHIDCASIYQNEPEVGRALSKTFASKQIKREEVFITSKLWNSAHAKNNVQAACQQTLQDLQLTYLDLYLIHWGVSTPKNLGYEPVDENGVLISAKVPIRETWEAMENLVKIGLVKNIGVANFTAPMLIDLLSYAKIPPAVNQIELHPYNQQIKLVEYCQYNKIAITAYSPLGRPGTAKDRNQPIIINEKNIIDLAKKYKKEPSQILIRWAIERNTVAIPKSVTVKNIKTNNEIFDFKLTPEDMAEIGKLEQGFRFVDPYSWWKMPYFN